MLSGNGHLFLCLNGILSWNVSNLSFLMSSVFLSPIKNDKQLNGNTLIEPIINSFFLCDMVKLKLFLQIWNWLRWTFSVGDLPRLASQVSCVLAVHRGVICSTWLLIRPTMICLVLMTGCKMLLGSGVRSSFYQKDWSWKKRTVRRIRFMIVFTPESLVKLRISYP